jgi:cell division protein FtsB
MRKILMSAVLLGTLASAAPAAAQYGQYRGNYGYNQGQNVDNQLAQLQQRVDRLYQRRLLSDREARRLSREIDQTDRLYDRYRRNGLTRGEYYEIQNRIQNLRAQIREERQEGRYDRRDDRYDDRYDRRY